MQNLPSYSDIMLIQRVERNEHRARCHVREIEDPIKEATELVTGSAPTPEVQQQHGFWHLSLHALFGQRARRSGAHA
jgi:hypothetical protein